MFCFISSSLTWYIIKSFSITLMFANFFCVSQELYIACVVCCTFAAPTLFYNKYLVRYLVYLFQVISVRKIERYKLRLFPTVQRLWSLTAIFSNRRRKMESIFFHKKARLCLNRQRPTYYHHNTKPINSLSLTV